MPKNAPIRKILAIKNVFKTHTVTFASQLHQTFDGLFDGLEKINKISNINVLYYTKNILVEGRNSKKGEIEPNPI